MFEKSRLKSVIAASTCIRSVYSVLLLTFGFSVFAGEKMHGVSIFGPESLKYTEHQPFPYLNPDAPKGGTFKTNGGYFTKLTPFGLRGRPPAQIELCFDTLGIKSWDDDEPYAMYGHIVQYYQLSDDKKSMDLHIRPGITFSDGKPLTAEDVLFSYRLIYFQGMNPKWKVYWKNVETMTKVDKMTVRVFFKEYTRDTPIQMSKLTVYPKHVYGVAGVNLANDFEDTPPVGSGPYEIERVEKGKRIVFRRKKEYWADKLPRSKGMHNFGRIDISVYYDDFSRLQALKSGLLDYTVISLDDYMKFEGTYLDQGYLRKETFPVTRPSAMHAQAFNLRRPILKDIRIRRVISSLFDFDIINKNIYYGRNIRLVSFFHLQKRLRASSGPAKGRVREELIRLSRKYNKGDKVYVRQEALTRGPYELGTDSKGKRIPIEERVIAANVYLDKLGWCWDPKAGARRKGDQVLELEFMSNDIWLPFFVDRLSQAGIKGTILKAGPVERKNRGKSFRYDLSNVWYDGRRAPGREMARHLLSERADVRGTSARMGLKNPAADEVMNALMNVKTRSEMEVLSKVFDRIMSAGNYVIPGTWREYDFAAFNNSLAGPKNYCSGLWFRYNVFWFWWIDPEREKAIQAAKEKSLPFKGK
jgi:microcin C transport system substrate-binding protein